MQNQSCDLTGEIDQINSNCHHISKGAHIMFSKINKEKGQGLVEYAIILALVAIVVIASMKFLGPKISCTFDKINNSLPGQSGSSSSDCGTASQPSGPSGQNFHNGVAWSDYTQASAVNHYCSDYGLPSGTGYNLYKDETSTGTYYVATGYADAFGTFQGTGACP
jgi:pilus assembly protein Flp/PilA